jgi:uncharacterized protein (DUF2062 family)
MASQPNFWQRFMHKNAPSREQVLASPWLKPFGQRIAHSELWRFTRRSVPRAVFAGLFVGIFLMVPGLQIVGAALLSMPLRANIPIAAAMTFLSNPLTTPFFLYAAIDVGGRIGFHTDLASFMALRGKSVSLWVQWLLSDAAPAVVCGLFLIGLGVALVGYIVSLVVWRWWVGRKWRQRFARAP